MLHAVSRSLTIWWPRFGGVLVHCSVCGSSVQVFRLVKRKWDCGAALNCLIESVPHEPLVCQSSVGFCSLAAAHVLAPQNRVLCSLTWLKSNECLARMCSKLVLFVEVSSSRLQMMLSSSTG